MITPKMQAVNKYILIKMIQGQISKFDTLKILFWNARSIKNRLSKLPNIVNNIDIFICVETWLTAESNVTNINVPGFLVFRKDRQHSKGGGILLLIRKNIGYIELSNITTPNQSVEMCGIHITSTKPSINIIACYRTPGYTLSHEEWNTIIENTNNLSNCVLIGDFNSHNKFWNCEKNDLNGIRLLNCIENNDLFIHNTDSKTYVNFKNGKKSNLDLVISTLQIADKITVMTNEDTLGSDHTPIHVNINLEKSFYIKKSFKLKSLRTNWMQFDTDLIEQYDEFLSKNYENMPANEKYEFFVKVVSNTLVKNTPKRKSSNIPKKKSFAMVVRRM